MDFFSFSKQSPKGFLIIYLSHLRKQINHFWVLIPFAFTKKKSSTLLYLFIAFVGVIFLWSLIKTLIRYKTFQFKTDEENFILKEGFFKKKETVIPFHKIINVNLKQNIVQQFINVTQVEIETAGSDKLEVKIEALSKENAIALKKILIENKVSEVNSDIVEVNYLQKITLKELFEVAITENHLQSLMLIVAFFVTFYFRIKDYIKDSGLKEIVVGTVKDNESDIISNVFIVLLISFLSSVLVSFIRVFIRHFNLKTYIKNNAIEIKQGLLDYKNNIIKTSKVQYLVVSTNPLKKIFGIFNVRFLQATSGVVVTKKVIKTVGVTKKQLQKIIAVFYTEKNLLFPSDFIKPHSYYKIKIFYRSLLILLALNLVGIVKYKASMNILIGFNFISIIIILFLITVKYKKTSFNYNNTHIQVNGGLISSDITYFEYYKIQKISLYQTIFQKKRDIADLHLQTASGEIILPCVAYQKAIEIYNHFLITVEKSNKSWV